MYKKVELSLTFLNPKIIQQTEQKELESLRKEMGEMTKKFDEQNRMMEMMNKQLVYDKFENVIEELKQERRALKQYGSISANEQFEYFMKSDKAKGMGKADLELIKKMVDSNEIPQFALSPPDEDDKGIDIRPLTKYESKKLDSVIDDDNVTEEEKKLYIEQVRKNLKNS